MKRCRCSGRCSLCDSPATYQVDVFWLHREHFLHTVFSGSFDACLSVALTAPCRYPYWYIRRGYFCKDVFIPVELVARSSTLK